MSQYEFQWHEVHHCSSVHGCSQTHRATSIKVAMQYFALHSISFSSSTKTACDFKAHKWIGELIPPLFSSKKKDDFFSRCFLELVHQWLWEKTESLRGGSRKQHSGPGMGCLCCGQNRYMSGIKGAGNHSLILLKTWDTSEAIQVAKACC